MHIAVSPYHLTTREIPALVALLLADTVETILPVPAGEMTESRLRELALSAPRYRGMLDSWEWCMPLFHAGVVSAPGDQDLGPLADVRRAFQRVREEPELSPLRTFVDVDRFAGDERNLDAAARDILRAGPDPAVSVPVAAGLDAYASRRGLLVARPAPSSMVQRAEMQLATTRFALSLPALAQASAECLLQARELLERQSLDLAEHLLDAMAHAPHDAGALRDSAQRFAERFAQVQEALLQPREQDEIRTRLATVVVRGVVLPPGAVLRASVAAARSASRHAATRGGPPVAAPAPSTALALREEAAVLSLVIHEVGQSSARGG